MVRRRLLSNSAKQASMSAYQNFWQQSHPQSTFAASMPQYWHSMCNKLGGAVPVAVMASPEAGSRRLSRVRRQLVKAPRESATNYVQQAVPLQRGYQTMWDRCCMNQGTLLKPGAFLPGFQEAPMTPQQHPQRSFQYQQGNLFNYPAAVQTHQVQWLRQHHHPVPVGILKKVSQIEASGLHSPKRVTIKSPPVVHRRFQAPSVLQVKPKPEVPPKPTKRVRQHLLKREQQRVLQQRELQRQQQIQKDLHRQQEHQKELQRHQEELQRQHEHQKELHRHQEELQRQQQIQKDLHRQQEHQKELQKQQQLQKDLQKQQERQEELQKRQQILKDLQIQHEHQKHLQKQQQLQKDLLKKQELQKELQKQQELQTEVQKQQDHQKQPQKQQYLQKEHPLDLAKMQQQLQQRKLKQQQLGKVQEQQELLEKSLNFNFGKYTSNFLENSTFHSNSKTSHTGIPATEPFKKPQYPSRNHNFSYEATKHTPEAGTKQTPEREEDPEDPRKRETICREGKSHFHPLDLGNETSTITLTKEQSQFEFDPAKTPYRKRATLMDKATNTQIDPLGELLKEGPQKAISTTGKGSRKLNINELLRCEQIRGLNADPMWHSLMQLVAQMCEIKEQEGQADKSRLRAGSGADEGSQKQYSVYLMVTSDEDEDETTEGESSTMTSEERIQGEDEFSERCGNVYQAEHPRLGRRKRTRKRLNPRRDDFAYPFSSSQPLLPMRRPLHWPKADFSKPSQGRSNRSRTPSRVRSRSSTRHLVQIHNQSSLSSVLDPKRSWRLWEDLPMTAKTLNKAYSRRLTRPGGTKSCTYI